MLEKPLDGVGNQILISEFDLFTQSYTNRHWTYAFEPRGVSIGEGGPVVKQEILDLNNIPDPSGISAGTGLPGDVGLGARFALPFQTIESVLVIAPDVLAVANDNNYPFDTGRHVGVRTPADNELILVKLASPLN